MDELALLYSHAFAGAKMDYGKLVKAFALRGRITLLATHAVKQSADRAMEVLLDLYMGPARSAEDMRGMMSTRGEDAIGDLPNRTRSTRASLAEDVQPPQHHA